MVETISEGLRNVIPNATTSTRQAVIVEADVDQTFTAIRTTHMSSSRAVGTLAAVRGLPVRIGNRLRRRQREPTISHATISDLVGSGYWIVLSDHPPYELVLGLVMWDDRVPADGLTHGLFDRPGPGSVKVGWSFTVQPLPGHRSLLVTETRTLASDAVAARRFRIYWKLISPFAALTRELVLGMIAREAARSRSRNRQPIRLVA
jgi:hypothetical protein